MVFVGMKITVKLFGDLKRSFPEYNPDQGLELEIAAGAKVADLLTQLGIMKFPTATVIMNGRVLSLEEELSGGSLINIFHVMYGG
jgi:sulfur carrier protein ThiS